MIRYDTLKAPVLDTFANSEFLSQMNCMGRDSYLNLNFTSLAEVSDFMREKLSEFNAYKERLVDRINMVDKRNHEDNRLSHLETCDRLSQLEAENSVLKDHIRDLEEKFRFLSSRINNLSIQSARNNPTN